MKNSGAEEEEEEECGMKLCLVYYLLLFCKLK
jgi:hypothetical protein